MYQYQHVCDIHIILYLYYCKTYAYIGQLIDIGFFLLPKISALSSNKYIWVGLLFWRRVFERKVKVSKQRSFGSFVVHISAQFCCEPPSAHQAELDLLVLMTEPVSCLGHVLLLCKYISWTQPECLFLFHLCPSVSGCTCEKMVVTAQTGFLAAEFISAMQIGCY